MATLRRLIVAALTMGLAGGCTPEDGPRTVDDSAAQEPAAERVHLRLANATAGWIPSGMRLSTGESVALFASGELEADGVFEPRHLLW